MRWGVLGLAAVIWRYSSPRPVFGTTVVLSLALLPVPLLLMTTLSPLEGAAAFWCAAGVCAAYAGLYLARGLQGITGQSQLKAAVLGLLFIGAFIGMSVGTNAIPDLWEPGDTQAASEDDIAEREGALFEQADRIDRQLDVIQRDESALPRAFFVGFAGVGEEKVFAQEIGLASRIIGEKYATDTRQLLLINDERNLHDEPLASVSGLDYAIAGLAAHMHLDRDVLFLSISSHGSSDPVIAVANSNFPLVDLSPEDLREALDDAGIQWRVIFISACYAGGFIEPLRNARTLVITAAAADRTSFGCASDSDLTYFGEAFYRDALPAADSVRQAFDVAKTAIATREHAEGETPSDPQIFFGSEIEGQLAKLPHGSLAGDAK